MPLVTRVLLALWAGFLLSGVQAGELLPRPAGLEPDIGFWRRIFAECTSAQGLIHDNRDLDIVYEKLDLSTEDNPARIQRVAEAARGKYERILRTLGAGKREDLSPEEERVLGLFPADVTNGELREAAGRVRFQQGLAERFNAGLIRSGQWHDHIAKSLREQGVPEELAALPHVESSFDPTARSFVGAAGLWQFTGDTGRRFMQIDQAVDERRDPYESSEAAARLLKYNYSFLGSWPLAITAYNHGLAGMRRAVERMGTDDIETIVRRYDGPAFGFASRNFYVSFLAALEIENSPDQFFGSVERKPSRADLVVELPDYMRVDTLEKAFGVSRSTMQAYNPALLPPVWEGAKYVPRGFRLRLPADGVIEAPAASQLLAAIPDNQRFAGQVPDKTHKVKRGDTLSGIAHRYDTSVAKLAQANGIRPGGRIRVGQMLKLPGRAGAAAPVVASLSPVAVAKADMVPAKPTAAELPAIVPAGTPPEGETGGTAPSLADPSDYLVADRRHRGGAGRGDPQSLRGLARGDAGSFAQGQWLAEPALARARPARAPRVRQREPRDISHPPGRLSPRSAGRLLQPLPDSRHHGAQAAPRRVHLGARRAEVQGAGLAAATVQPETRLRPGAYGHAHRLSESGEGRMTRRTVGIVLALVCACAAGSAATTSAFERADRVVVRKAERKLYLMRGQTVLRSFKVALGLSPQGPKLSEGDFRTPEGTYELVDRNSDSDFFLSIRISYPNTTDVVRSRSKGHAPGGGIMIHGLPNNPTRSPEYYRRTDWTNGCIAVSNSDMVDIWLMTAPNTPIDILP